MGDVIHVDMSQYGNGNGMIGFVEVNAYMFTSNGAHLNLFTSNGPHLNMFTSNGPHLNMFISNICSDIIAGRNTP